MSLRDKYTDEEWWELVGKSKKPSNKIINNSLDYNYQNLLKDIIDNGNELILDPHSISYELYKKLYFDAIRGDILIKFSKVT